MKTSNILILAFILSSFLSCAKNNEITPDNNIRPANLPDSGPYTLPSGVTPKIDTSISDGSIDQTVFNNNQPVNIQCQGHTIDQKPLVLKIWNVNYQCGDSSWYKCSAYLFASSKVELQVNQEIFEFYLSSTFNFNLDNGASYIDFADFKNRSSLKGWFLTSATASSSIYYNLWKEDGSSLEAMGNLTCTDDLAVTYKVFNP